MAGEEAKFNVQRFDPGKDNKPYFKEYTIPVSPGMTVLEGLAYIKEKIEPLDFRSSCRAGVCGSCGMTINGKYRLACETHIASFGSEVITIAPIAAMEVIKDLLVDDEVKFKIQRFDSEQDKKPYFKEYKIPVASGMTILEGLSYIQEHLDGSIAFRSSCRAGVCGSCAMHINGKYRLACETQIALLQSKVITVKPLAHLKILKDLIVDMEPFWEKYRYIMPYLIPCEPNPQIERIQTQEERVKLEGLIDCILCACCQGTCTLTGTDEEYLGPAILLKADRFVQDSRDKAMNQRLDLVGGDHGVWRCHTIYNCQVACPKKLDPTGSIANLKRKSIDKETRISFWGRI